MMMMLVVAEPVGCAVTSSEPYHKSHKIHTMLFEMRVRPSGAHEGTVDCDDDTVDDDVGNGDDNKLTLCAIKEALMTMMIL